jgi:hypothetical protein
VNPGRPQNRLHGAGRERLVLRRERVDRRRDHEYTRAVESLPREAQLGEDDPVGLLDMRQQERPGVVDVVVGDVRPDVAAPYDARPGRAKGRNEARGLGSCASTRSPGRTNRVSSRAFRPATAK